MSALSLKLEPEGEYGLVPKFFFAFRLGTEIDKQQIVRLAETNRFRHRSVSAAARMHVVDVTGPAQKLLWSLLYQPQVQLRLQQLHARHA
jgi:hypothetical protein